MTNYSRLIEHAFPLRQASIDSVHEKNVRHGHLSTLHIWPARRPLAASRAALLATLLPDPGTPEARKALCEKIGGKLKAAVDKDGRIKEVTEGGILRWKREIENKDTLDWLRGEIRKAYGGRSPRVLDPFAGGGAIPLEAMRLGCEVTAADLNPVAWFILKCTLDYPQKLAGQMHPLPQFILSDREFMKEFLKKGKGFTGAKLSQTLEALGHVANPVGQHQGEMNFEGAAANAGISLEADVAWHVRAWGRWVLANARKELGHFYPTYADWQPLTPGRPFEPQPTRLIDPNESGVADAGALNADLTPEYLENKFQPRWVAKPTVAYLWARTVFCKNCRAVIPLLKTRWLCKKENKRIRLLMEPQADRAGATFSIEYNVPERGGNGAQKREHDKKLGIGTMSKAGAQCLCCPTIMETDDIRYEGKNGRLGKIITAVVVDGPNGKEYRLPTQHERELTTEARQTSIDLFAKIPYGFPVEPTPGPSGSKFNSSSLRLYGFDSWKQIFTDRQILSLGVFVQQVRKLDEAAAASSYPDAWREAIAAYLGCAFGRLVDYSSEICIWALGEFICHTFTRYALPITWDFVEGNPIGFTSGNYAGALEWVGNALDSFLLGVNGMPTPTCLRQSALKLATGDFDVVITDPPYYDAIAYGDLMDFFHVWQKRIFAGSNLGELSRILDAPSSRWSPEEGDGELIDNPVLYSGDKDKSRDAYETGMLRAFEKCHEHLNTDGKMVVVFAHKHPDAWEALVSAIMRAGFVVDASWPIQTERETRMRAYASAALSSSVWLVCRKRDPQAKIGWDNRVMAEMRQNISAQLREFWDAGIRGPDFVWAATGPAMEAYSKHPAVKKANSPTNEFLSVKEFLDAVRRIVIEFVVGRVLHIESGTDRLDSVTSYYLLHRNDFGFEKAPAGACILYAVSCGISDAELERTWNLVKVKGSKTPEADEAEVTVDAEGEAPEEISGGEFILRTWKERNEKRMGFESIGGREVPLIDRVHRLMHLWRDGDARKVDDYLDQNALRRHELFMRLIQSLIELSEQGSEERALLESLSNHLGAKAAKADTTRPLAFDDEV